MEYEYDGDCAEALENMHGSELFGKVLRCSIAKPVVNNTHGAAIWTSEDWIHNNLNGDDFGENDNLQSESLTPAN